MAHFAQLDEKNFVIKMIVVHNNEMIDNGVENEEKGIAFCKKLLGADTRWIQTSYNGTFRKNYAGIGYKYDANLDAFIPPKPEMFPSFVLDETTAKWKPPVDRPTDTVYRWDEPSVSWVAVPQPFPSWTAQGDPLMWVPPTPRPGLSFKWDENSLSWIAI
jgi:hypothetical protein